MKTLYEKLGTWACPACGDTCEDPERITATQCHNGHSVTLGTIDRHGRRTATLRKQKQ